MRIRPLWHQTLICLALSFFAAPATAQVPTLTLGTNATVNLIPPGPVTADGKRISLTVLVTDETGSLSDGAKFRGSGASAGRLDTECGQVGRGLYNCSYTTPDKVSKGKVSLRLRARLASGSTVEASFPITVVPETRARLTFSSSPDRLILSQDLSSQLSLTVVDQAGNPMDGLNIKASANVGEIQGLESTGSGTYKATYVAPTTPFPQVAILSVWDGSNPDQVFGFFRIPLIGKVNYPVNARAPGVTLVFKVGDTTFPPVTSDASGLASVPITVPPGVPSASVEMIQPSGARSTQKIDLQVPSFNRMALGGIADFLPADGRHKAQVQIYVVDIKGRPADSAAISLTTTQGTLTPVKFIGNGLYEATFTAPALSSASRATITAALDGEEMSSSDSLEIGLEPGGPVSVDLAAEPTQITPDVKKVTLTATLRDEEGQPATGSIEFRTAKGPIKNPKVISPGVFSAELPVQWDVVTRVHALAGIRGNRQAVDALLGLPLSDQVLTNQKVPVTILSLDRYGNPVANVAVNASVLTGGGTVTSSVQTDSRGIGTVLYTAGPLVSLATIKFSANNQEYITPIWQGQSSIRNFSFPISGGQQHGRLMAKWRKLRQAMSLGGAQQDTGKADTVAAAPAWGAQPVDTSTPVVSDKGSVSSGTIAMLELTAIPNKVATTGGAVNLLVRAVDAKGQLVPGEQVILLSNGGMIANKVNNGDGTFSALLTIPPDLQMASIQVTATRPQGDIAAFTNVGIGGAPPVAAAQKSSKKPKPAKVKKQAKVGPAKSAGALAPADSSRMARRTLQVYAGWTPGGYTYDANPCDTSNEADCEAPGDADLNTYDFLKTRINAGTLGSFQLGAEWFPFQDYVGVRMNYARLAYSTTFEANTGEGSDYCATHFCDSMNFLNIDAQGRFALLKNKGPLDLVARFGYQFQDLVLFRRLARETTASEEAVVCPADDPATSDLNETDRTVCTDPRFETISLHGVRVGFGVRYTIIPLLRAHIDYNLGLGISASLGETSFGVPGVTNHNFALGMNFFPWKGLLFDVTYDLTTRALGLSFDNEQQTLQRGRINEAAHTVRISAGWSL